jgi:hypothetical protein
MRSNALETGSLMNDIEFLLQLIITLLLIQNKTFHVNEICAHRHCLFCCQLINREK